MLDGIFAQTPKRHPALSAGNDATMETAIAKAVNIREVVMATAIMDQIITVRTGSFQEDATTDLTTVRTGNPKVVETTDTITVRAVSIRVIETQAVTMDTLIARVTLAVRAEDPVRAVANMVEIRTAEPANIRAVAEMEETTATALAVPKSTG